MVSVLALSAHAQSGPSPASETKVAAARQLGQAGIELYTKGDTAGAVDKLRRAYAVYPAPTLGLWYGRALERAGKVVEAAERYREVAGAALGSEASAAFRQAQVDAQKALGAVTPRIAQLTIEVPGSEGAGLTQLHVTLDGSELPAELLGIPIPVNPGKHVLKAAAAERSAEQAVELKEGQPLTAKLALTAAGSDKNAHKPAVLTQRAYAPAASSDSGASDERALSRTQVVAVMHGAQKELNRCGRGRAGGAIATLSIRGATGQVESAQVKLDDRFLTQLPSSKETRAQLVNLYTNCMTSVLVRTRFPLFQKPVFELDYVFRFAGSGAPQSAQAQPAARR
jgi:hypothetical protein